VNDDNELKEGGSYEYVVFLDIKRFGLGDEERVLVFSCREEYMRRIYDRRHECVDERMDVNFQQAVEKAVTKCKWFRWGPRSGRSNERSALLRIYGVSEAEENDAERQWKDGEDVDDGEGKEEERIGRRKGKGNGKKKKKRKDS
jgi:hypothetical protein